MKEEKPINKHTTELKRKDWKKEKVNKAKRKKMNDQRSKEGGKKGLRQDGKSKEQRG
jgi:hypothetical protein